MNEEIGKLYETGSTDGLLGNTNGVNTSPVDSWLPDLDVNNEKLQEFPGSSNDFVSIANPKPISTIDITNDFVTSEKLPQGDNRIDPAEGINLNFTQGISTSNTNSTFNYGEFISALINLFAPQSENSFPSALAQGVNNGTIDSDLK
jgi:hypothetical protein